MHTGLKELIMCHSCRSMGTKQMLWLAGIEAERLLVCAGLPA